MITHFNKKRKKIMRKSYKSQRHNDHNITTLKTKFLCDLNEAIDWNTDSQRVPHFKMLFKMTAAKPGTETPASSTLKTCQ